MVTCFIPREAMQGATRNLVLLNKKFILYADNFETLPEGAPTEESPIHLDC